MVFGGLGLPFRMTVGGGIAAVVGLGRFPGLPDLVSNVLGVLEAFPRT